LIHSDQIPAILVPGGHEEDQVGYRMEILIGQEFLQAWSDPFDGTMAFV
jgi:hypothetical protein